MPAKPQNTARRKPAQTLPKPPKGLLQPGQEAVKEIRRLAVEAVGSNFDNRDQSMAILELLTHLIPHDKSGWALTARMAVMRASDELADEAADLLIAAEQERRAT